MTTETTIDELLARAERAAKDNRPQDAAQIVKTAREQLHGFMLSVLRDLENPPAMMRRQAD